jgi:predicted nucleic acid-binding protein
VEKKKRIENRNSDEFVVDSSVVVKWFLNEKDTDIAIRVRDGFATDRIKLSVPTLLFYEVMNALRFSGTFTEQDLNKASKSLSKYRFEIWRPVGRLLELSTMLSLKEDLTVYDASYIGLAYRKGSKVLTEDRELIEKFPKFTLSLSQFKDKIIPKFLSA